MKKKIIIFTMLIALLIPSIITLADSTLGMTSGTIDVTSKITKPYYIAFYEDLNSNGVLDGLTEYVYMWQSNQDFFLQENVGSGSFNIIKMFLDGTTTSPTDKTWTTFRFSSSTGWNQYSSNDTTVQYSSNASPNSDILTRIKVIKSNIEIKDRNNTEIYTPPPPPYSIEIISPEDGDKTGQTVNVNVVAIVPQSWSGTQNAGWFGSGARTTSTPSDYIIELIKGGSLNLEPVLSETITNNVVDEITDLDGVKKWRIQRTYRIQYKNQGGHMIQAKITYPIYAYDEVQGNYAHYQNAPKLMSNIVDWETWTTQPDDPDTSNTFLPGEEPDRDNPKYGDGALGDISYSFDVIKYWIQFIIDTFKNILSEAVSFIGSIMGFCLQIASFGGQLFSFLPEPIPSMITGLIICSFIVVIMSIVRR